MTATATLKSALILAAGVTVFGVLLFSYCPAGLAADLAAGGPVITSALTDLWYGFGVALEPHNLLWCFVGVLIGNMVGVLPGMGAARHHLDPVAAHLRHEAGRRRS